MGSRWGDVCAQTRLVMLSWTTRSVEEAGKHPNTWKR